MARRCARFQPQAACSVNRHQVRPSGQTGKGASQLYHGPMFARLVALALFLSAAIGIGLELNALMQGGATFAAAAWTLLSYFTILTNGIVAVTFAILAVRGARGLDPRLIASVVAAIVLVGVVFALLLQGLRTLAGATATANFLLHQLNPRLAAAYWLAFTPKGRLGWRDPQLWALWPLLYLGYAMVRGGVEGRYPYPFIDVGALGAVEVTLNAAVIAAAFVAAGEAMVWIDRRLGRAPDAGARRNSA